MDMKYTWFAQPLTLHSSRAFTCEGFETAEQCEWYQHRWHFWYQADWVYALPTIAFFMCTIGIFIIANLMHQIAAHRRKGSLSPWRRLLAATRYLSYRGFRIEVLKCNPASVGLLLLAAIGSLFFLFMTVIPQPYYWPGPDSVWGNSPPLGTRSGWMALACMPFVFATASKASWLSLLTGVSHERLQVFHRWISYAFFVLALLHTFPFIVFHIRNHDMRMQFTMDNYFTYWTGVVALIFQAWLTFGSHSWLRNLGYEFFKAAHFVAVILFVLIFFWHCGGTLTSWDYFVATAAVYVPCLVFPWLRTLFEYGVAQKGQLSVEDNEFMRISIPANFEWVPGQHCFLRTRGFGLHALTSHPFTICSLPALSPNEQSELIFYIRHRGGFTRTLYEHAGKQSNRSVPLLVDGPYGGIDNTQFYGSDRILVVAGGSGAGWSLPFIEQYVRSRKRDSDGADVKNSAADHGKDAHYSSLAPKSLRLILATKETATRVWFHTRISDLLSNYAHRPSLEVEVYLTGEAEQLADEPNVLADLKRSGSDSDASADAVSREKDEGDRKGDASSRVTGHELHGRPHLPSIIREEAAMAVETGQSLAVFVCGPETMQHDVRNAVAEANLGVMKGSSAGHSVYLHLEHFSWA